MVQHGKRGREELSGAIGCLALLIALAILVVMTIRGCMPAAAGPG